MRLVHRFSIFTGGVLAAIVGVTTWQVPSIAAGALLHPSRRPVTAQPPSGCDDVTYEGNGVTLRGWRCRAQIERRGFVIVLHGVADNRSGVAGVFERFTRRGFDVIAYDSRAHGESGGEICTYGYHEKGDLRRVIETLPPGPIVLIGSSLGAAVALQAAAEEPRVGAVVAAEVFSDLNAIARERAPSFLPDWIIRKALRVAEVRGRFEMDRVSPAEAARMITAPVLLIHGALDTDTPPDHSRRVHAGLRGPKRLKIVDGAAHNQSLSSRAIWRDIAQWLDTSLAPH